MRLKYVPLLLILLSFLMPIFISGQGHGPISINSNQELLEVAAREGWPGDGSPDNPIVISNLEIDADGGPFALYLGNTTLHVVVRNCVLRGAASEEFYWGGGLVLNSVSNLTIEDSRIENSTKGVIARYSFNIAISNLNISVGERAVLLNRVQGITVSGIRVSGEPMYGMATYSAEDLTVSDFTMDGGSSGILLLDVSHADISAHLSSLGYTGMYITVSDHVTIHDTEVSHSTYGMIIRKSDHIVVRDSVSSNNTYFGIYLHQSQNITLTGNRCNMNGNNGIYLKESDNNLVVNNTCNFNLKYYGISVDEGSEHNLIEGNAARGNGYFGIGIFDSDSNLVVENRLEDNGYGAITIVNSSSCVLWSNAMVHGGLALLGTDVMDLISHEVPENNTVNGRPLRYVKLAQGVTVPPGAGQVIVSVSSSVVVEGQDISDATFGILVIGSSRVVIRNNTLRGSPLNGIFLVGDTNAVLRDNVLDGCGVTVIGINETHFSSHDIDGSNIVNGRPLVYLSRASGARVSGAGEVIVASSRDISISGDLGSSNIPLTIAYSEGVSYRGNISNAGAYGILVFWSSRVQLNSSISSGNIYIESSDNLTIGGGAVSDFDYGILIDNSDNVSISNVAISNMVVGVSIRNSKGVSIENSTISNSEIGVDLYRVGIKFENNTVSDCAGFGLRIAYGSGTVRNNNFLRNNGAGEEYDPEHAQALCAYSDVDIRWNFWSDWTGPDEDGDGYVDEPYVLAGNCQDPQPRAAPIVPEFGF